MPSLFLGPFRSPGPRHPLFRVVTDRARDPSITAAERVEEDWRRLRILRQLGLSIEWRLSPETMGIIEDRLRLPSWASSAEDFESMMLGLPTAANDHDDWVW